MNHFIKSTFCLLSCIFLLDISACTTSDDSKDKNPNNNNGDSDQNNGGDKDNIQLAPYHDLSWTTTDIDVDNPQMPAGIQGKLLQADDGTLYYGYYKFAKLDNTCDIAVFGSDETVPGVNYEFKIATKNSTSNEWTPAKIVPLGNVATAEHDYVTALYGLDGTFDSDGNPVFALAAGGSGLAQCGSSDLVLATLNPNNSWSFQVPATDSNACCAPDECPDPACTSGTDVGAWATIDRDPSGNLAVAFVDYHNYWDEDGQSFQGYEMWHQSGGVFGIKPWSGLGNFGDLVYAGDTAISFFCGFAASGLYVLRRAGNAGSVNDWEEFDLRPKAKIGQRISAAVAPNGNVGVAFHEIRDSYNNVTDDLIFCESLDQGKNWQPCKNIDLPLIKLGLFPSLAYDKDNRPLIAYYVCSSTGDCNYNDKLRLAWREDNGTWSTIDVYANDFTKSGQYPSLVVNSDYEVTIGFQDLSRGAAMVAHGTYE